MDHNFSYQADMAAPVGFGALPNDTKGREFAKILSVDFGGIYDNLARKSEADFDKTTNAIIDAQTVKLGGFGSFNQAGAKFAQDISEKVAAIVNRENHITEELGNLNKILNPNKDVKSVLENGNINISWSAKLEEAQTAAPIDAMPPITGNATSRFKTNFTPNKGGRTH